MSTGSITDVPGIELGHTTRRTSGARTGVTVVMARAGAVAGVAVRGGGPGTRETDALSPTTLVERIHAICLGGGSAFGLGAAQGVMEWCREQGLGVDLGRGPTEVVPVVPAAVIFDLGRGGEFTAWPTAEDGRAAAAACAASVTGRGSIGAGTGAMSGGLQGGLGTASHRLAAPDDASSTGAPDIWVGALAVVNSSGSVLDPDCGLPWVPTSEPLRTPTAEEIAALEAARLAPRSGTTTEPLNTVIGVVATSADLTVAEATTFAAVAHDGLARAIRPAHSMFDGDTIFSLATGQHGLLSPEGDELHGGTRYGSTHTRAGRLNALLEAGAACFAAACTDAIISASRHLGDPLGPPAYQDCAPGVFPTSSHGR